MRLRPLAQGAWANDSAAGPKSQQGPVFEEGEKSSPGGVLWLRIEVFPSRVLNRDCDTAGPFDNSREQFSAPS